MLSFARHIDKQRDEDVLNRKQRMCVVANSAEDGLIRMITKRRVSAYGGIKGVVDYLRKGDTVFYYQEGFGIIAAARITGAAPHEFELDEERYWDVQFVTAGPTQKVGPPTS